MSGSEEYEGSVPPLGEDIPEEDWDAANADGATGTEEDDGDVESYDTEDEDPIPDAVSLQTLLHQICADLIFAISS